RRVELHRLLLRRLLAFKRSGARILGRPDGSLLFCMRVRNRGRSDSPSFDRRNAVVLPTRTAGTSLQCRRVNFIPSILRSTSTTPRLMLSAPVLQLSSVLNVALACRPLICEPEIVTSYRNPSYTARASCNFFIT